MRHTRRTDDSCRQSENAANHRCLQTFPARAVVLLSAVSAIRKLLRRVSWPALYQPAHEKRPYGELSSLRRGDFDSSLGSVARFRLTANNSQNAMSTAVLPTE